MLNSRSNVALACMLTGLAGYIDGIGFIHLGGLFVSFMSGNSTRLGVMIADANWPKAIEAIRLIVLFVAGAAAGSLIGRGHGSRRQPLLLLVESLLLAAGALSAAAGWPQSAIGAIVLAMGLENAVFQVDGVPGIGLTYMTGTLVRVGQLLAAALVGGQRWAWLPNLLLWVAMVIGAFVGAMAYQRFNLAAVWFAAGAAAIASMFTALRARFAWH
jgi:uncharacterized membrane protein YoaK (UPF0700 family)